MGAWYGRSSLPRVNSITPAPTADATPSGGGCCTKPSRKSRCARAALGARAAGRADIATDRLRARDEMAVFRAHP